VNPELWSPAFLQGLLKLLRVEGRLVTYSVSGHVRRSLQELGASVSKQPGPVGGKRQMLLAVKLPLPARNSAPGDQ
jgi:tRNA U34 5-methylaminomethyl-2-thiouridine-forming methyltransferase MnmC